MVEILAIDQYDAHQGHHMVTKCRGTFERRGNHPVQPYNGANGTQRMKGIIEGIGGKIYDFTNDLTHDYD